MKRYGRVMCDRQTGIDNEVLLRFAFQKKISVSTSKLRDNFVYLFFHTVAIKVF